MATVLWNINGNTARSLKKLAKDEKSTIPAVASKLLTEMLKQKEFVANLNFPKAKKRGRKPLPATAKTASEQLKTAFYSLHFVLDIVQGLDQSV